MKRFARWFRLSVAASAALALLGPVARAQSYGEDEQVLTISAVEFGSEDGSGGIIDTDSYLINGAGGGYFRAPLNLPDGARIEQLCLYAKDSDPSGFVQVLLIASKLVPGGEIQRRWFSRRRLRTPPPMPATATTARTRSA